MENSINEVRSYRMLYTIAYVYLIIPYIIFAIGWLDIKYALVMVSLLSVVAYKLIVNKGNIGKNIVDKKTLIKLIVVCLILVLYSGVGGFIWQNRYDHMFRNAAFLDLINYKWPVINGDRILSYYIGFWLPAAIIGKIFGVTVGYIFQVIWAAIGLVLVLELIYNYIGSVSSEVFILFVMYSGLDIIEYFIVGLVDRERILNLVVNVILGGHIELTALYFNSSSNITLLFWLYNHIIGFWISYMIILSKHDRKNIIAVYALMSLYAPIPMFGAIPVVIYYIIYDEENKKIDISKIRESISIENICMGVCTLFIVVYYMSNNAVNNVKLLPIGRGKILAFIMYMICEYLLYIIVTYQNYKGDNLFKTLFIWTVICSFVVMGDSYDFAWRTCIPFAFYLMLKLMKLINENKLSKVKIKILTVLLIIGAITPCCEVIRTMWSEVGVICGEQTARSNGLESMFDCDIEEAYNHFIGDAYDTPFSYIMKRVD